jgi:PHD/YefM family antitoxin component YafN of YafNO toxin-antitoxin module
MLFNWELRMNLSPDDIVPISQARARLTELADDVASQRGAKVLTRNGESYVALVRAAELEELEQLREQQRLSDLRALIEAAEDMREGRTRPFEQFRAGLAGMIEELAGTDAPIPRKKNPRKA